MEWPAQALGFITEPYHQLADDWWFAIPLIAFIFSLITLQCRKSSVVMQRLMTSPSRTKVKRFDRRKFISDTQRNKFLLSRLLVKQRAAGGSEAPRSGGPGAQEAGRAEGGAARRLSRAAASHLPEAAVATLFALPFMAEPAYAYVDPSVMTYTIQALAGVAVALSAVLGVAFRKTRRKLFSLLKIDENARKEVEGDIHRVVAAPRRDSRGEPSRRRKKRRGRLRVQKNPMGRSLRIRAPRIGVSLLHPACCRPPSKSSHRIQGAFSSASKTSAGTWWRFPRDLR